MILTERDRLELSYLRMRDRPLWGGHVERGEPITAPRLQKWVDEGLIEYTEVTLKGYVLTEKGKQALDKR